MAEFMKNLGARMVDEGFHILPLAPGQKYPAEYGINGWRNMARWERYGTRLPTELELAQWAQWPGAGIGVVCGRAVVAIDIDFLDAKQAYLARQMTQEHLGITPAHRIGAAPKLLMAYRAAQEIASASFGRFEVLGLGRQFVSYGIHPTTQAPYVWPVEGLADLSPDALPAVTAAQIEGLCAAITKAFPAECGGTTPLAPRTHRSNATGDLRADLAVITSALSHIPNADLSYTDWMLVGMALKGAVGCAGADLFHDWSAKSAKNAPGATAKAWLSYKPDRIGAGTIFHIAKSNGWTPPPTDYSAHPGRNFFQEFKKNG